jgi:aconitate hydratase
LINFGVLPLTFANWEDFDRLKPGTAIHVGNIAEALKTDRKITADTVTRPIALRHSLSTRQIDILLAGGAINRHKVMRAFTRS